MKFDQFKDEAEGTSRTLARNFGARVTFEGSGAFTDRRRVNLPMLPESAELSAEQVRITRGYIDHESGGHQRFTDIDAMEKIMEWAKEEKKPAVPKITNAMEDVRIEPLHIRSYPGAKKNLEATVEAVCRTFIDDFVSEEGDEHDPDILTNRKRTLPLAITWAGRKMEGYASKALDKCIELIDDDIYAEAEGWAKEAIACSDTWSVFELAKKVSSEVYEDDEEEEEEGEGQPKSDEGDGDTSGGGGGDGDEGDEGDGDSGGDENGDDGRGKKPVHKPGIGDIRADTDEPTKGDPIEIDFESIVQKEFDSAVKGIPNKAFRSKTDAWDAVITRKGAFHIDGTPYNPAHGAAKTQLNKYKKYLNRGDASMYAHFSQGMRGIISTMRRKLERGLEDMMRRGRDDGKEFGALDTKRLVQAFSGQPNVFWMPEDTPEMNTAVEVLVDLSGSMHGEKLDLAQMSAICLAEAMNTINVPFEVTGFFNDGRLDPPELRSSDLRGFSRYENETYYVFKGFNDTLRESKGSLASIRFCCGRENCDGVSVAWAGRRLMKRPENKKVLIVLSDGQPAFRIGREPNGVRRSEWFDGARNYVRDVVAGLSDTGMHVVGIGICDNAVQRYYKNWVVINDIDELPGEVMSQVAKVLMGQRVVLNNKELMKASSLAHRRVA